MAVFPSHYRQSTRSQTVCHCPFTQVGGFYTQQLFPRAFHNRLCPMCGPRPSLCAGTLPPSSLAALQLRRSLRSYPHRFSCPETDHFSVIIIRPPPRIRLRAHPVLLSPSPILAPHLASHMRASVKLPPHLPDCACPHGIASAFVVADCFHTSGRTGPSAPVFRPHETHKDHPTVPSQSPFHLPPCFFLLASITPLSLSPPFK